MKAFSKTLLVNIFCIILFLVGAYFVLRFISATIANDERTKKIQILESEIKTLKWQNFRCEEQVDEIEITNASCSATLQACLGSCVESQLLDVVQEAVRIKR
jgi:hypothetical protein